MSGVFKTTLAILVYACAARCVAADCEPALPARAEADQHNLSVQQVAAMYAPPRDAKELLLNLEIAWNRRLLVQRSFYNDRNLERFFKATSVVWERAAVVDPDFSSTKATVTLDATLFGRATVLLSCSYQSVKAQPHPEKTGTYLPAYRQKTASISMDVESMPGFTWGSVEETFGPGAQNIGTGIISESGTPGEPAGKAMMRYLYPGDDPAKLDATRLSFARFLVRGQPMSIYERLKNDDVVTSVQIFESVRY